jgi:hypothetical protein
MRFCMKKRLDICNTQFRKQDKNLYTHIQPGTDKCTDVLKNTTHFQIDYALIHKRWRNGITNIEAIPNANLMTTHSPLVLNTQFKLKSKYFVQKTKAPKFQPCTPIQNKNLNEQFRAALEDHTYSCTSQGTQLYAKLNPKPTWVKFLTDLHNTTHSGILTVKQSQQEYKQMSPEAESLLESRKEALQNNDYPVFLAIDNSYKAQAKRDKQESMLAKLDEELDERSKNLGLKSLKQKYKPRPYARKRKHGEAIPPEQVPEEAAQYLENTHWGPSENDDWKWIPRTKTIPKQTFNTEPPTMNELKKAIRRLKRNKAPGPDELSVDILKELSHDNLKPLLAILLEWWEQEHIPDEALEAYIALIHKKGDSSLCENYRPISLLNTINKIIARIIVVRIQETVDKHLLPTQFGFRPNKSTGDAVHCVRRILTQARCTTDPNVLVLLDWEKAFDKLTHEALFITMERLLMPPKLINMVKALYRNPQFMVCIDGLYSEKHKQHTGIRQGCPLSPYLFILAMHNLMHDVNTEVTYIAPVMEHPSLHTVQMLTLVLYCMQTTPSALPMGSSQCNTLSEP